MRHLRPFVLCVMLVCTAGFLAACTTPETALPEVIVYKSPTCGCCSKWVAHLEEHGFTVKTVDMTEVASVKARLGVPGSLVSCHTASVGSYIVEGHVPADVVLQLLEEQPEIAGLAVPGMPIGSPGMEGPNPQPYDILAFDEQGSQHVYARR